VVRCTGEKVMDDQWYKAMEAEAEHIRLGNWARENPEEAKRRLTLDESTLLLTEIDEVNSQVKVVPKKKPPKLAAMSRVNKKHFKNILSLQNKSRARKFALVKRAQDLALIGLREMVRANLKAHGHACLMFGREGMFLFGSESDYSALDAGSY
jgi:hypothetical protein